MPGKQYGLILPNKNKGISKNLGIRALNPLRDSDEELEKDDDGECSSLNWVEESLKKSAGNSGQKSQQKRLIREALEQDLSAFQYDEVYDDMKTSQNTEKQKELMQKKPKYIDTILKHSEKRKLERERRIERKVQKERDAEGEEFQDKESFVTPSYLKKLEEIKKAEAEEKVQKIIEERDDVTKHKNIGLFYNHLYKQRINEQPAIKVEQTDDPPNSSCSEENSSRLISKRHTERSYRRRDDESDDDDDGATKKRDCLTVKEEPKSSDDSDKERERFHSLEGAKSDRNESRKSFSKHTHHYRNDDQCNKSDRSQYRSSRDRSRSRDRSYRKERNEDRYKEKEKRDSVKETYRYKEGTSSKSIERYRKKKNDDDRENESSYKNKKPTIDLPSNKDDKFKESVSKKLGVTSINKMKIEDRIERFQRLFVKRTVGDKFDSAVQKYFARKADRESIGLL